MNKTANLRTHNEPKVKDNPVSIATLSEEEMNTELEKGYADILEGRTQSVSSVFADIRKDYGV